jgi:hypothetical protein
MHSWLKLTLLANNFSYNSTIFKQKTGRAKVDWLEFLQIMFEQVNLAYFDNFKRQKIYFCSKIYNYY